jgi:hypothetical protein
MRRAAATMMMVPRFLQNLNRIFVIQQSLSMTHNPYHSIHIKVRTVLLLLARVLALQAYLFG